MGRRVLPLLSDTYYIPYKPEKTSSLSREVAETILLMNSSLSDIFCWGCQPYRWTTPAIMSWACSLLQRVEYPEGASYEDEHNQQCQELECPPFLLTFARSQGIPVTKLELSALLITASALAQIISLIIAHGNLVSALPRTFFRNGLPIAVIHLLPIIYASLQPIQSNSCLDID